MDKTEAFLQALQELGSKERALKDAAYHKSSRSHFGVPAALSETLVKEFTKGWAEGEKLSFAKSLWASNLFDPMLAAARLLSKLKGSGEVFETLLGFLPDVDGWALEDTLAHSAWKCILADESKLDVIETFTTHPNFWMRRAALVYTLPYAKKGKNPERSLSWAASYASDREWFIQKAIGWWLRTLGAHNEERVLLFLEEYGSELKGVAKKEALRKLSQEGQNRGRALVNSLIV